MKHLLIVAYCCIEAMCSYSQNVGIGTPTPGFPLNFSNALGDKISLYGASGNHYGFGIQGALLQMHTDAASANIAFGYGSSAGFTERMRLYNSGGDGMLLNGRITLKNGTTPLDLNYGPGIWLYKSDNSAALGFMGTQNNQNVGFYGGPAGWGFTYDAVNSRVGIGNNNPNAPLSFPASTGRKITLYPGAQGNVGMGVYGNEFRLHTDYAAADITMGYENTAGVFTERMRVKGNGAIGLSANAGAPGDVIQSNGAGSPATWGSATSQLYNNMYQYELPTSHTLGGIWSDPYYFNNLTQTITLAKTSKVLVSMYARCHSDNVVGEVHAGFYLNIDNTYPQPFFLSANIKLAPGETEQVDSGLRMITLPAGTHTFKMSVINFGALFYYGGDFNGRPNGMVIIVVPE